MSQATSRTCGGCGAQNRDKARFCGSCGEAFVEHAPCPNCQADNLSTQGFCDECGSSLKARAASNGGAPERSHNMPRTLADGRYQIRKFLGEGGRKTVFLAHDTRLRREVAVALFKSAGADRNGVRRARREAEAMAALGDHPNVVTVHDIGEENGALYLVSQYMAGGDLVGILDGADNRQLSVEEVVRIGSDVARALEHVHAHDVIHRDLKPQNIWLAPDGTAKIGDFGLARSLTGTRLTAEGAMIGTVAYMSPEQALGHPADTRSDVYALGAVLYELLCGVPPFVGDDAPAVISQHVSTAPIGPSWHRADVPVALEQLILRMLAKTPGERPDSAAEVRQTLHAIAAVAPDAESPRGGEAAALDRLTDATFLGRERETKELRVAVDEAVARRGRLVLLAGEPGIGKTRLATEIETYANLRGAQVLWGRCYDGEGAPAYWPWVQIVRSYVHDHDPASLASDLGPGAPEIAQVVSDLRDRLPDLREPEPLDPEQARFRLFDSISTFLVNASNRQPLALFLDDLHLADTASLKLLQFLARELAGARIFLLATYRDDELADDSALAEVLAALSRERSHSRARLRGLSDVHVKALLEAVLQQSLEEPEDLALAAAVHRESSGNPYLIEEIVRHLIESGGLQQRDGRWTTDDQPIEALGIADGARHAALERLGRLSQPCMELLSTAAVLGNEFRLEPLSRVCGADPAAVLDLLEEATEAAVVRALPSEPNRFRFGQAATRDALYRQLSGTRRAALHHATGEALEDLYGDRVESHLGELAHHFAEAAVHDGPAKGAEYSWWAGERAEALHAYDEAVGHYERALGLFSTMPDEPLRRCELLLALGDARWRAGDKSGSEQTFLDAAAIAQELNLPQHYARAALGYGGGPGGFSAITRPDEQLVQLLRAALDALPDRDSTLRVRVLARLAVELYQTGDAVEPDEFSRAAVDMAERLGDTRIVLLAMYSRQWAIMSPDVGQETLAAGEEIVRLARLVGDRDMEFQGHHLSLIALLQAGDLRGVDREIGACDKLARDVRQPGYLWQVAVFRAMRALMQGRWQEGDRLAQTALSSGQRAQGEFAAIVFGAQTFLTSWAGQRLETLVEPARGFAENYGQAWPAALTWLLSEIGEVDEARERLSALARDDFRTLRRDADWLTAMCCLSLAAVTADHPAAGAIVYEQLRPYADRYTPVLGGSLCLGSNHAFVGFAARAAHRLDDAIRHLDTALRLNARIGAEFLSPRIHAELAVALVSRGRPGDRDRAAAVVETGLGIARRLGARRDLEQLVAIKLADAGNDSIAAGTSLEVVARSVEQEPPDLRGAAAPDGTVTVMFSDIEGSTLLTERLGDWRWFDLLRRHNEIVRNEVRRYGGFEVRSQGDGFMIAFSSALAGVGCAVAIQRQLAAHRTSHPPDDVHVRIGLHTGEAVCTDGDFFGKNVVLAARIAASAAGDEILVSSLLRELVASTADVDFVDERCLALKGLHGEHRVVAVDWAGTASEETLPAGPSAHRVSTPSA